MELTILYDNEALEGFKKGWGFSCLIKLANNYILFDTGDGPQFLTNLQKIGLSPSQIDRVILSHPHYDHIGGLGPLLELNSDTTVYVPSFFPVKLKMQLMSACRMHETFGYEQIIDKVSVNIATNHLYEQFCVLELSTGLLILTGCAHPGLENILTIVQKYGKPIFGVLGGFHDFKQLELLQSLAFIAPCHCTSYKTTILHRFDKTAHACAAGVVFTFQ